MKYSDYSTSDRSFAKTLLSMGAAVVVGGLVLLLVFVAQNPLQQSQDLGSQASVTKGSVEITAQQSPREFLTNSPVTIDLRANTSGVATDGIQLVFDVLTASGQTLEVKSNTARLKIVSQEVQKVAHGFKVAVMLIPLSPTQSYITAQPESFLSLTLTPTTAGEISLNFDKERSLSIKTKSNPPEDLLTHVPVFKFTVYPADTDVEDFYLVTDNIDSRFTIRETSGSRNEVDKNKLVAGTTYTVTHQAKVQNTRDVAAPVDPVITAKLKVNSTESQSATRTFKRSDLLQSRDPLNIQFETTFTAQVSNTFEVMVDSERSYVEGNENNNTTTNTYTTSSTAKSCNETCSSNADCSDSYRCYDLGSEKRCRLVTNLSSTSCTDPFGAGERTCNQYCANDAECKDGLTCWYNQCRSPYNVESSSCPVPSTQTLSQIAESCNDACSSNRDCANNMRCYNGQCRLATNPSSSSCSPATSRTVSGSYGKNTPAASARPTATPKTSPSPSPTATVSATPKPTAIPTPTPTPVPVQEDETALDSVFSQVEKFFSQIKDAFSTGNLLSGPLLPVGIVGAGVLLLIIALVIILKPKKHSALGSALNSSTPAVPKVELHPKPNPAPPLLPGHGVIPPQKETIKTGTISGITNASRIEEVQNKPFGNQEKLGAQPPKPVIPPKSDVQIQSSSPLIAGSSASPAPASAATMPPLAATMPKPPTAASTANWSVSATSATTAATAPATPTLGGSGNSMIERLKSKGVGLPQSQNNS